MRVPRPERPKGEVKQTKAGPKGRQLEVGARRAPRLLVYIYCNCVSAILVVTSEELHTMMCKCANFYTLSKPGGPWSPPKNNWAKNVHICANFYALRIVAEQSWWSAAKKNVEDKRRHVCHSPNHLTCAKSLGKLD